MNILVCRSDKIGDVTIALPSISYLRTSLPADAFLAILVSEYTEDVIRKSNLNVEIIRYEKEDKILINKLKKHNFDAAIVLFSTWRIGKILFKAKIPYRLAPATKLAQIWYSNLLIQRRSESIKPEYQYNIDLVTRFLEDFNYETNQYRLQAPYLFGRYNSIKKPYEQESYRMSMAKENDYLIIAVSISDGGSAPNNLSIDQYFQLVKLLNEKIKCCWLFTCDHNSQHEINELCVKQASEIFYFVMTPRKLGEFIDLLANCDFFIGGSTGPLHLAAALNKPVIGFYSAQRTASAVRWQVVGETSKCLSIQSESEHEFKIDIKSMSEKILKYITNIRNV